MGPTLLTASPAILGVTKAFYEVGQRLGRYTATTPDENGLELPRGDQLVRLAPPESQDFGRLGDTKEQGRHRLLAHSRTS